MSLFGGVISLNDIFKLLTLAGFIYYLVRSFLLKKPPLSSSDLKEVDREKIVESLQLLYKRKNYADKPYIMPGQLERGLIEDLHNKELLRELLRSITVHMGIEGDLIQLRFQDDDTLGYAGQISTGGALTTINLQLHEYYDLDVITAILAHEAMHLYLHYNGIYFSDTLMNEVLTDTAAVYFGFGQYLYRGYKMLEINLGTSYHKVGYINPEDVQFIQNEIRKQNENDC